jgi:hypothetical protein
MYALVKNGVVVKHPYTLSNLKQDNPNTSFVKSPKNETLAEFGMVLVFNTTQPAHTSSQYLEEDVPVFNAQNQRWEQVWLVKDKLYHQLVEENLSQKESNKNAAVHLLQQTDWTSMPDVSDPLKSNPYLANQAEFTQYRSIIRNIAINPTVDAVFPDMPTEIWSNT